MKILRKICAIIIKPVLFHNSSFAINLIFLFVVASNAGASSAWTWFPHIIQALSFGTFPNPSIFTLYMIFAAK